MFYSLDELTGGVGADVNDLALGSVNLMLIRCRQLSFNHYGVLGPGLHRSDQVPRVLHLLAFGGTGRSLDIGNRPAVRATRVLAIKLGHVPIRPGADGKNVVRRQLWYSS